MFSARLSSRNCSPNFVFSKDSFLFCNLTLFSDVLTWDRCCRRCCRCCFSNPHREGNGFPMHARKFDLRFNVVRILCTILVIFHGRLGRFWTHRSSCTAPWWCIGWEWFSPSTSAASEKMSTLEIVLANIPLDVLVLLDVADVHQCSKVDFPYLLFCVCLLYDLLSFLFHCRLFIWNQHCLGWKIFYSYFSVSRGMRLWETDLQSLLNHTQLSIPKVRWSEPTFVVHTSFFPGSHLRVPCTPRTFRVTSRILSHRYAVPRDETTCACFHLQRESSEELPQDVFIGTNSCAKLY